MEDLFSLKQLAQKALDVQNACNLSGVLHTFDNVIRMLWVHARSQNQGTDWVNEHAIVIVFLDKLNSLAGIQKFNYEKVEAAYASVYELAK